MSKTTKLSLQVFTFFLFLIILPLLVNSQISQEKTILLNLKDHWLNPESLSHWTSSSDPCTWPELNCTGGSVTGIHLANQNITETIPSFICDLKNLTILDLHLNFFPGQFPKVLYNCSNLEYLDLSLNSFVGNIPDDIDKLSPRLEYFSLEGNNFTGDIPATIGGLKGLRQLKLSANFFNGSVPSDIGNLSNLEVLVLSQNGFAPQEIPTSFTKLTKLKDLWMHDANLIGEIPEEIGNMASLEYLDLSVNGLTGSIPDGLFLLKNLSIVYLYKNNLSGPIPQSIEALNLQIIDLSYNNLNGTIPEDFGKLTSLTGLALFTNNLSGEVPASIGRLPLLEDVGLFTNNLSGELPQDFGKYSMLRTFQVSTNNFVGNLPEHLCSNGVLMGLIAFENKLTGELPKSLANCGTLEYFRIHGNKLSGDIPDGLWSLRNLTWLTVNDNSFTGQIPSKIASNLTMLDISNNQFSGEIPEAVATMKNLQSFKASNNFLSGRFPQELTSFSQLTTLLLNGNNLSGELPSNIISWNALAVLNLSRNRLSGKIPSGLGRLRVLTELDLSENDFSGEIPPEIGRLRPTGLNFSSNRLSGKIPGEFENAAFNRSFLANPGLCANDPSLGLNSCASQTRKSSRRSPTFIAAVSSIAGAGFLVILIYAFFLIRSYRKRKENLQSTWKLTSFQKLNFTESTILSSLTDSFLIGSGGSGKVYRVPLNRSGGFVAVKKICNVKKTDERLEKQFVAEVEILGTIRHSNIVKLMCCISAENSKLLVYEYMENRSLDRWLHYKGRPSSNISGSVRHIVLEWPQRLNIAIGAAKGLCYMHHDCSPPIIHRDIKSSNILLDSAFNAKIADFGLASILEKDGSHNTMSVVAGSFGYIAPEYAQTRRVNEKIDVYSFGVILLELVTGRHPNEGDENSSLAEWAWRHIHEEKSIVDAIDEDIKEECYIDEITNVFKLGIFCTHVLPSNRPTMRDVLQILLRCSSHLMSLVDNKHRGEYDVAPLLSNSRSEKLLEDDDDDDDEDGGFTSIV